MANSFSFLISVVGDFPKKILESGVREKMDKAMMFLVQKSAAGVVDARREELSRSRCSVSIELLDDHGW